MCWPDSATLASPNLFVAEPHTAAFSSQALAHTQLCTACVCVCVSFGCVPVVAIIRGVFDMSQFPHRGMTCPQPGNTEQTNSAQPSVWQRERNVSVGIVPRDLENIGSPQRMNPSEFPPEVSSCVASGWILLYAQCGDALTWCLDFCQTLYTYFEIKNFSLFLAPNKLEQTGLKSVKGKTQPVFF